MAEIESIMTRLDAHASQLKARSTNMHDDDSRAMAETIALMSEAMRRVSRDVRIIRSRMAQIGVGFT